MREVETSALGGATTGQENKRLLAVPHRKRVHRRGCGRQAHDGDAEGFGELDRVWDWPVAELPDRARMAGCFRRRKPRKIREVRLWEVEVASKPGQKCAGVCPGCDCDALLPKSRAAASPKEGGIRRGDFKLFGDEVAGGEPERRFEALEDGLCAGRRWAVVFPAGKRCWSDVEIRRQLRFSEASAQSRDRNPGRRDARGVTFRSLVRL